MDPYFLILIFSFFIVILLSGVFTLFDSALLYCRKTRLEKESGKKYRTVLKTLENPQNISLACRLWSNILKTISVILGVYVCYMIIKSTSLHIHFWVYIVIPALILGIFITLLGDSLPRLLSHTKPEKIASVLLPAMKFFSVFMMPFTLPALKFASFFNTKMRPEISNTNITEEELQDELRNTLIEGEKSGVVENNERNMVEGVFYLGDRPVGAFMTHRSEIQWLDINAPYEEIREKAIEFRNQRCFPVGNASPDEIVGAVFSEDIILDYAQTVPAGLRAIMSKPQFVPETMPAIKVFESFKQCQSSFLFVMDEYGGLAGIISITDLVEEIVGELSLPVESEDPFLPQDDGTWLADGTLNIDDAAKSLGLTGLGEENDFHTLAGFILHLAGELPRVGDSFEYEGFKFKVVDKDGNRIDKLLISKIS
ncbi:MAG: hemolysin family protein [Treponema sp.]|nr:hemolysin family protein [Treponema sp.]MCL2237641.1 hemolysin family protein [Treponema sp.]